VRLRSKYDYVIALGVLGRFHKFRVYVVMISDDKIYNEKYALMLRIRAHSLSVPKVFSRAS